MENKEKNRLSIDQLEQVSGGVGVSQPQVSTTTSTSHPNANTTNINTTTVTNGDIVKGDVTDKSGTYNPAGSTQSFEF
ncbi:hypothetical protein AB9G26_07800 [Francisella philomiragia]|uniref:hypothetical protein n=1 Tax=Francisella philomiragia TaxID=28110 RepID=UPI003518A32A